MALDILGRAISEYYFEDKEYKLWVHDHHGPKVEMVVPIYFRSPDAMPDLELMALDLCTGRTLDIGAGAGSHSLYLQDKGIDILAIDISEGAVMVMHNRGVRQARVQDIFQLKNEKFDTLLLLMNGIGLVQNIDGLKRFLQHTRTLLNKDGQLLFDSSDVAYLYEDAGLPKLPHYYGEVECRYEYRRQKSDWFSWLYIDQKKLREIAHELGYFMEVLFVDESEQYLVRLTLEQ
jgi:SAM-dependent methyltransferase